MKIIIKEKLGRVVGTSYDQINQLLPGMNATNLATILSNKPTEMYGKTYLERTNRQSLLRNSMPMRNGNENCKDGKLFF